MFRFRAGLTIAVLALVAAAAPAQTATGASAAGTSARMEDVVFLKDGSVIRGAIVERADSGILIRTRGGNVLRYAGSQIDHLGREPAPPLQGLKSPPAAFVWSLFIPGAGQAYNGQWGKAGLFLGTAVVGNLLMLGGTVEYATCSYDCDSGASTVTLGAVLLFGSWAFSMIDAPVSSTRINKRIRETAIVMEPRLVRLVAAPAGARPNASALPGEPPRTGLSLVRVTF